MPRAAALGSIDQAVRTALLSLVDTLGGLDAAGIVKLTVEATAPKGYLLLQGQTITNGMALYPKLWKAIPAGWKSGSNIVLPDARGRTMIGAGTGAGLTARTLGALLGEEAHTLTSAESGMPTHGHGVTDPTHNHTQNAHTHLQVQHAHGLDGTGAHVVQDGAASGGGASLAVGGASYSLGTNQPATATNQNATATNIAASTGVTVNNATGVNATNAHNNMQPSLVLNWIIKT